MKQKGIVIIALILGVVAVVLVQFYIRGIEKRHEKEDMVAVLVASKDVPAGTALAGTMIDSEQVPKRFLNPNAVLPKDLELIIGQTTAIELRKDQQILWSDFVPEETLGLSSIIKEGERAITIEVGDRTGVAGLLRPNDHVDIIGTFRVPKEVKVQGVDLRYLKGDMSYSFEQVTVTLLQNVTVLATGGIIGSSELQGYSPLGGGANAPSLGSTGSPVDIPAVYSSARKAQKSMYRTVTLLVTPLEAELIVHAIETGALTLALRNPEDLLTEIKLPSIKFTDIVKPEFMEQVQESRTKRIIEVIKGPSSGKKRRSR